MAVLDDAARAEVRREYMIRLSSEREPISVTKQELRAAFNAIDDWFDANAATINAALPEPAKSALTVRQKARLLSFVLAKRYEAS